MNSVENIIYEKLSRLEQFTDWFYYNDHKPAIMARGVNRVCGDVKGVIDFKLKDDTSKTKH